METTYKSYSRNKTAQRDWSWLYIVSFIIVAVMAVSFEQQIELNQLSPAIDYN